MFSKLLKHDIRDSFLEVLVLCGALLAASTLVLLGIISNSGFLLSISIFAYVIIMAALAFIVLKVVIQSFHTRLFTNMGYLTLTTPVSIDKILLSKVLVSMLWQAVSAITILLSVLIIWASIESMTGFWHMIFVALFQYPLRLIQVTAMILSSSLSAVITLLFVLVLANMGRIKRHRLLKGILIYIGLGQGINILIFFIMMILSTIFIRLNLSANAAFNIITIVIIVLTLAWSIGFYFLSRLLIIKKLELE